MVDPPQGYHPILVHYVHGKMDPSIPNNITFGHVHLNNIAQDIQKVVIQALLQGCSVLTA